MMAPHGSRTRTIRLIPYAVFDAVTNMAIDEALLELHLAGKTPASLRFYGWHPAAVSFGYSQKVSERTVSRVRAAGYDPVRRPTGGRAVLHEGELTYCFVGAGPQQEGLDFRPANEVESSFWLDQGSPYIGFLPATINEAYKDICDALIFGLKELGVNASLGRTNSAYKDLEDCFQATTQADLQFEGKKIVGSAQLRRRHGVLQHGSIMIDQSQTKMAEIFQNEIKNPSAAEANLAGVRHCNLREIMSSAYDRTTLEEAIGLGFTSKFNCHFAVYDLTDEEMEFVEQLKSENRYKL